MGKILKALSKLFISEAKAAAGNKIYYSRNRNSSDRYTCSGTLTVQTYDEVVAKNETYPDNYRSPFTNPGYHFVEWNTKADGTGQTVTVGTTYESGMIDLYAVWERDLVGTTWVFNDTIELMAAGVGAYVNEGDLFIVKDTEQFYNCFAVGITGMNYRQTFSESYQFTSVYENNAWIDDAYKTIIFVKEPDGYDISELTSRRDFYEWLEANAVKQTEVLDVDNAKVLYNDLRSRINTKVAIGNPEFTGSISLGRKDGSYVGTDSVAIGEDTYATGQSAIALGRNAEAYGDDAIALGREAKAINGSVAIGKYVQSYAFGEIALGKYNKPIPVTNWVSNTEYAVGDHVMMVTGQSYGVDQRTIKRCIEAHTSSGNFNFDTSKWETVKNIGPNRVNSMFIETVGCGSSGSPENARELDIDGNETVKGNFIAKGGSLTLGNTTLTENQLQSLLALLN